MTNISGTNNSDLIAVQMEVNGKTVSGNVEGRTLLVDFLRKDANLRGPRIGCEEGACGACTVDVGGQLTKSCLRLAVECDGATVRTVEALAENGELTTLQRAFRDCHALQCGFCTSGMLMSAEALLRDRGPEPLTDKQIKLGLGGNYCRCTGYSNIIRAIKVAAGEAEPLADAGDVLAGESHVGRSTSRKEDDRLLRGNANYVDNFTMPGMLHMTIVPSTQAHARILNIDVTQAKSMPGVAAVLTGADIAKVCGPMSPTMDAFGFKLPRRMPIADEKTIFFGEPVALVLAETPEIAEDAAARVFVDYDPLPVITDPETSATRTSDEPEFLLYPEWGDNLQTHYPFTIGEVDESFETAHLVMDEVFSSQRYSAQPMETRGVLASWDSDQHSLIVRASVQIPHQFRMFISKTFGIPETDIQVLTGDIGGGFGGKLGVDAEYLPVAATRILGRPVKWIEPRSSWTRAGPHARDFRLRTRGAFDADGKLLAMDVHVLSDIGCDGAERAGGLGMPINGSVYGSSIYDVSNYRMLAQAAVTNKPPYGAYRGYGKDIANLASELLMERAAEKLGINRVDIRERNFPESFPYRIATGPTIEDSSSRDCYRKLVDKIDIPSLEQEKAVAQANGKYIGYSIVPYIEPAGAAFPGTMFQSYESASVRVNSDGTVRVFTGMTSLGQGIETVYAQVAADLLGCRPDQVRVKFGDTNEGPFGSGTYSSRGAMYAVGAIEAAAAKILPRMKLAASRILKCDIGDVSVENGVFTTPSTNETCTYEEVAYSVYFQPGSGIMLEGADSSLLEEIGTYLHPDVSWEFDELGRGQLYPANPGGAQAAKVEVNIKTGRVKILKLWLISDHGTVLNPMLLDGQIMGSVMQQLGGTMFEEIAYDNAGKPHTKTMKDYGMPSIWSTPDLEIEHMQTRSKATATGAKGAGEDGSIATTTTIVLAVEDALRPLGVKISSSPLTPARVLDLINRAQGESKLENNK
ncbi:molybdopterin-dependent oxidoreductase [Pacificibacter marinus]|uniref:molybdopterin-dependent oxidoreductase n=1 Tax=Pacificibacter marinus TaxID=658057 RepID=UPI001C07D197|nr:molybdopterin-dependent oxidoreductase [Pacificibacter marinus]MBU2867441.1 molybdopterin-dependent oxidoreductase [Pacificibacter marinus]